jgi:hypothetical protein
MKIKMCSPKTKSINVDFPPCLLQKKAKLVSKCETKGTFSQIYFDGMKFWQLLRKNWFFGNFLEIAPFPRVFTKICVGGNSRGSF